MPLLGSIRHLAYYGRDFLGGSRGPVMHSRHQVQFEVKIVSGVFLAAILGIIVLWFVSK